MHVEAVAGVGQGANQIQIGAGCVLIVGGAGGMVTAEVLTVINTRAFDSAGRRDIVLAKRRQANANLKG